MGIWIELGVFMLVFVFAAHQMHDLKKEKKKREAKMAKEKTDSEEKASLILIPENAKHVACQRT